MRSLPRCTATLYRPEVADNIPDWGTFDSTDPTTWDDFKVSETPGWLVDTRSSTLVLGVDNSPTVQQPTAYWRGDTYPEVRKGDRMAFNQQGIVGVLWDVVNAEPAVASGIGVKLHRVI